MEQSDDEDADEQDPEDDQSPTLATSKGKGRAPASASTRGRQRRLLVPNFPVCLRLPSMPNWLTPDEVEGRRLSMPFIAHAVLMLPTFNHVLQAIRRRTPPHRVEEGEWTPRHIFGSTSVATGWRPSQVGGGSRPDAGDVINIEDDEDVRGWLIATAGHPILRMCVVFHQVDRLGNQTPSPEYRPYLPPTVYRDMEEEEQNMQYVDEDEPPEPVVPPPVVPASGRPRTRVPTVGESAATGASRGRVQRKAVPPSPIAGVVLRPHVA